MIIQHLIKEFDAYLIAIAAIIPTLIGVKVGLKKLFGIELKSKKTKDAEKLKNESRSQTMKNAKDIEHLKKEVKKIKEDISLIAKCLNKLTLAFKIYVKGNGVTKSTKMAIEEVLDEKEKGVK